MLKWIVLVLAGYVLYRLFVNDTRKKKQDDKKQKDHLVATGEMVKDPVCGAYVAVDGGVTVRDGDKVHRFCSYECRDAFIKQLQEGGRVIPELPREKDED